MVTSAQSIVSKREKSYQFYQKRVSHLCKLWDDCHCDLNLAPPDHLWTQTINRILFNQKLISAIQGEHQQQHKPQMPSQSELGADEENIIHYMAGYIHFKLLKTYEKKDTKEAADIVDCLSAMAQSGPEDDFSGVDKSYQQGGVFEVSNVAFSFIN